MDEDLKNLVQQNIVLTQQVLENLTKVNRYIFWQKIISLVYFFLIIGPIIFAAIYLPPLFQSMLDQYKDILQTIK